MNKDKETDIVIYGDANVQQYKTDVGFKTLVQGVSENLYVIPDFQRVYKWTEHQVEDLAISLIKGMPIPPIYAYRNKQNQLEILDGQQRVLSMFFYYIGKYTKKKRNNYINLQSITHANKPFQEQLEDNYELKDKNYEMKYYDLIEGKEVEKTIDITYSRLSEKIRRKLDYTSITVIEINIDDDRLRERYLYKIFANLNAGGTPLTNQELRNGIYRCKFYEMLFQFNVENDKWNELFGNVKNYSRNIEYLLRFCAFKYFIKFEDGEFKIENYKNMNNLLNDFSQVALIFNDKTIAEYRSSIEKFMSLLNGRVSTQITFLEGLFTVIDKKHLCVDITPQLCENILNINDYKNTIRQGNATKTAIETKLKVVYNAILKYTK
ncbi:DUF262 domain-containing protein [Clostridium estertheticum]|uniref:DUF262 domain-containing protein n=1 Tax=Clostridium estertheticum TaxID=238834 RepID=A0AA47EEN7_9CLOT|nr:DUF262 domain-containing protein [Clostridium estertheticum]MBU3154997.1 DUF262 domain-containing protein [Clostridium estertheticum]WAG58816.1 DUF262 domain-containing protein [Clostridium estertheticum]